MKTLLKVGGLLTLAVSYVMFMAGLPILTSCSARVRDIGSIESRLLTAFAHKDVQEDTRVSFLTSRPKGIRLTWRGRNPWDGQDVLLSDEFSVKEMQTVRRWSSDTNWRVWAALWLKGKE